MDSVLPINSIKSLKVDAKISNVSNLDQEFHGNGKLLLSSEYFILKGAKGLALPTKLGQSLTIQYSQSFTPTLYWKSFDYEGDLWLEGKFEFWHFNIIGEETPELIILQKLLRQARKANFHFLRDEVDVHVETHLDFPLEWGLGSSSTLIHNIAQWAYISPFELLFEGVGKGSGYDIACAQSQGPILYERKENPHWEPVSFNPKFKSNIYFLYLGNKQDTQTEILKFETNVKTTKEVVKKLSEITDKMVNCEKLDFFNQLIQEHEEILAESLKKKRVKDEKFSDFWGEVKSLGAWGGDFCLITSEKTFVETRDYFFNKGYNVLLPFDELVLTNENINQNQKNNNDYLH